MNDRQGAAYRTNRHQGVGEPTFEDEQSQVSRTCLVFSQCPRLTHIFHSDVGLRFVWFEKCEICSMPRFPTLIPRARWLGL